MPPGKAVTAATPPKARPERLRKLRRSIAVFPSPAPAEDSRGPLATPFVFFLSILLSVVKNLPREGREPSASEAGSLVVGLDMNGLAIVRPRLRASPPRPFRSPHPWPGQRLRQGCRDRQCARTRGDPCGPRRSFLPCLVSFRWRPSLSPVADRRQCRLRVLVSYISKAAASIAMNRRPIRPAGA